MYLTATYKLRANLHDRRLLDAALRRWHAHYAEALDRAGSDQAARARVRACLVQWTSKDGERTRWVVERRALHALVLHCTPAIPHLHSSARMSMVVAVEEQLKSYLGLYAEWMNGGRRGPKPQFPTTAPGAVRQAQQRWEAVLAASTQVTTLEEEDAWRAEVTRAARLKRLPMSFGACTSGVTSQAHCGLLRRQDGRYFALLTLFPQGDPLGAPVQRASNREARGPVSNIRGETEFRPTRARASIMCPLEIDRRQERLYLERGTPKSAELVYRDGEYYLHVATEIAEQAPAAGTGATLAIRRGITTLASAVVVDSAGRELERVTFSDKGLAKTITSIRANRAKRQQEGKLTRGDRRAARITEETLYLLAHDILRLAQRHAVSRIALLADPKARKPQRFLAWKHWSALHEILTRCAVAAGMPEPKERKIYGAGLTCLACGWAPGAPVRHLDAERDQCPGCRERRDPEWHLALLLAHSEQRLAAGDERPLGEWIRERRTLTT